MQNHPSRRKFCFYAIKILFHRDETKIASFARGKSDAVNCPRTDGSGRISVGGYVKRLYLCMLSIFSVTYLYGYHQPYAQSFSSEDCFFLGVLIHSAPLIIEAQDPHGLQDGAKAHSLVKLKLQPSQATLSYRVAAYFLKTLQIVASGFVDVCVVSFSAM